MSASIKSILLKWYLRLLALIQFVLWGLSHLFFPKWYLTVIAGKDPSLITDQTMLMVNEIGVSVIGLSIATWIIAAKPLKNFPVILMIYIFSLGSLLVTLYHILIRQASSEWSHVFTVLIMLAILTILYPWKELFAQSKKATP